MVIGRRGARDDGRWGGQGGARSAETAPLLRVPALHLSTPPHSLWVLGGVRAPQFTGLCALSWGKAKRRFPRAQGPGDLGDSVGASPPAPGRTPPAVLRASGPRDDPGQCIGGAQGPGVARWEGTLPKHSCYPGPPMVAALSAYCLPLPWEVKGPHGAGKSQEAGGSGEIWGFPLSSRHPSLPEAEGGDCPQTRQDQVSGDVRRCGFNP
ncbi:uncharacterized protein [Odocoileus virginianus]|uniref:Uncharacterized protein n=1 Tax=Odocoileus virginianus TaxID=9874 RepID=A0ABM4HU01_ODOVR